MMSPAHSAASAAAADQTTGNYSFANTSFGQTSYKNTTGLQTNLAPSLSGGFFHENSGVSSAIYSHDEQILRQSNSELRTSLFSDDSISQSLQTSKMHAQSTVESTQKSYSENLSSHARNMADLSTHLAHSENSSSGISSREAYDFQESGRYFQNTAENWGKQYGLSARTSMELLVGLGIDKGIVARGTTGLGSNKEEALSSASNLVKSEEFQKHFQKLQDISSSDSFGSQDETGKRLAESASHSYEQMQSSQHAFQIAQSELTQVSENATWAEQNSHSIRRALNQDFINWASAYYADAGGFSKVQDLLNKGDSAEQSTLVSHFIEHIKNNTPNIQPPTSYVDPEIAFTRELPHELTVGKAQEAVGQHLSVSSAHFSTQIPQKQEELTYRFSHGKDRHDQQFSQVTSNIETARDNAIQHFHSESDRSLYARPFDLAAAEVTTHINKLSPILGKMHIPTSAVPKPIASGFQIKEEPFWMKPEEIR